MLDHVHIRLFSCRFVTLTPRWWRLRNIQNSIWRLYVNNRDGAFLECSNDSHPLYGGRLYVIPTGVRFNTNLLKAVGHFYVKLEAIGLPNLARLQFLPTPVRLSSGPPFEQP